MSQHLNEKKKKITPYISLITSVSLQLVLNSLKNKYNLVLRAYSLVDTLLDT